MKRVLVLAVLFALGAACRHGRCYRDADCSKSLVCRDPEAKEPPAAKRCAESEVRCVTGCAARCTPGSCSGRLVCGGSGCCEPKPCKLHGDCGGDDSCVDGKCSAPGRCLEPPSG